MGMVLGVEEGSVFDFSVYGKQSDPCVRWINEPGTDEAECCRNGESTREVAGVTRSLLKPSSLRLRCARVLRGFFLCLI